MVKTIGYKNTDIGMIPNDWDIDILENRLKIQTGSKNTENKKENGKYPFFVRSSKVENIDTYQYDCEAVLTAGDGVGTGKVFHYINGKFDAHQRVYILTEFNGIKGKYLYYYFCENFLTEVHKYTAKSSVDSVRRDMIAKMAIPVPDIKEQQAIAEALSDTDNLIFSLQKLIEKKKAIKQGVMQELLSGKKRLSGFSGEWKIRKIGELCSVVTKQTGFDYTSTIKPNLIGHPQSNTLPMIQTKNFRERKFDFSTDYYIPVSIAKLFKKIVLDDVCLLFSIVGASVGNIGLFPSGKVAFCGGAIGIAKFYNEIDTIYSFYYFLSESGQQQIRKVVKGGAQATVTIENIREFIMPYPTIKERAKIIQALSDMDSEIEQLEQKLLKYQRIKQGMMQELLSGRIRLIDSKEKAQANKAKQPTEHNSQMEHAIMIAGIVNAFYSPKYFLCREKIRILFYFVMRKRGSCCKVGCHDYYDEMDCHDSANAESRNDVVVSNDGKKRDCHDFLRKSRNDDRGVYFCQSRNDEMGGMGEMDKYYKSGELFAHKKQYIDIIHNKQGSCFEKGVQIQQALNYLQDLKRQEEIDWLVSQFWHTHIDELELLATIDRAMCSLKKERKQVSLDSLKALIHSSKEWKERDIQRAMRRCKELFG